MTPKLAKTLNVGWFVVVTLLCAVAGVHSSGTMRDVMMILVGANATSALAVGKGNRP